MREPVLDEPVVVLTSARSGSTLLRMILDAHPDLACPPETNIIKICSQLGAVLNLTAEPSSTGNEPDQRTCAGIQVTVAAVFGDYLKRRGKIRWCDKSLGTAASAEWFLKLYPKTRFICLYRHCMDVINSGLEASPWGLMGYGFEQFSGMRSGNSVSTLGAYWVEYTARILEFEKTHQDRCFRVHYERLADDPERTAGEIFSFVGVDPAPGISERCFVPDTEAIGPGDHKIRATRKITTDSVGKGVRIPSGMLPPPQLKVINHLLGQLDYTPVDDAWRRSACPPVLLQTSKLREPEAGPTSFGDSVIQSVLEKIGGVVQARVNTAFNRQSALPAPHESGSFGLVAYHPDRHRLAHAWKVDLAEQSIAEIGTVNDESLQVDWLLTGDVETWLGVLSDRVNMATCMRTGALRYIGLDEEGPVADEGQPPSPHTGIKAEERLQAARELLGLAGYYEEVGG